MYAGEKRGNENSLSHMDTSLNEISLQGEHGKPKLEALSICCAPLPMKVLSVAFSVLEMSNNLLCFALTVYKAALITVHSFLLLPLGPGLGSLARAQVMARN